MIVIAPKELLRKKTWKSFLRLVDNNEEKLIKLNEMLKYFYEWCLKTNSNYKNRLGCSFSRSFNKTKSGKNIAGLKYCFVSPHTNNLSIKREIRKLNKQFERFLDNYYDSRV